MKLWQKSADINKLVEEFTVGRDHELDLLLARFDILGTLAHITMLESIHLLSRKDYQLLTKELKIIYKEIEAGDFILDEGIEDIHSQVEFMLTQRIGEAGKKIHSARSRNDQVLLDIKLFARHKIISISESISELFGTLIRLSDKHKDILMPGYTHLQIAMPSSFGLWFGAYAESLSDDLILLQAAFKINNQNPLGSAAGYGSSFPINRELTTKLLAFDGLNFNAVYAQMGRGKVERIVSQALGSVAATLSKMANDICLFMSQNFGFVSIPEQLTTGSSIMPHKKNPDVFELIRARCNKIQALANEVVLITNNLPSGYFRDLQIIKENYLVAFDYLTDCINMTNFAIHHLEINVNLLDDEKYKYLFSVEEVNRRVLQGIPFREAYKQVGEEIQQGKFNPDKNIVHTHAGSIGNLCNDQISEKFNAVLKAFNTEKIKQAERRLLN
jgi:argininosuccinate lyase